AGHGVHDRARAHDSRGPCLQPPRGHAAHHADRLREHVGLRARRDRRRRETDGRARHGAAASYTHVHSGEIARRLEVGGWRLGRGALGPKVKANRFVLFLAAVFVIKLVVVLQLRDHPLLQPAAGLESGLYAQLASQVSGNRWLGPGLYLVPPLYLYFLAALFAVGSSITTVRVIQIELGTAAVALVFVTARGGCG